MRSFARIFCATIIFAAGGFAADTVVAPFANRTPDTSLDWIGESLAEAVREALEAAGASVPRRPERQQALERLALPRSGQITLASSLRLAEALEASRLIAGHFDLLPNPDNPASRGSLTVTLRLIDPKQLAQVAEFSESGALEDLAALQSHVAFQALQTLQPHKAPAREEFDRRHPAVRATALENYVRGLMAADADQQHRYFALAARADGRLWQPCLLLGQMHWEKENYQEAASWLEKVPAHAAGYRAALLLLGLSRFQTGEYQRALHVLRILAADVPSPENWNNVAAAQLRLDLPEAEANFRKALAGAPSDPDYHFNLGYALWKKGGFEEAADLFRAALDREPDDQDAILLLGRCLKSSGPRAGDLRTENLERLKDAIE
jgi:tetratricopeptide (TPR) repeat protein